MGRERFIVVAAESRNAQTGDVRLEVDTGVVRADVLVATAEEVRVGEILKV
jgi:hypothetical protein